MTTGKPNIYFEVQEWTRKGNRWVFDFGTRHDTLPEARRELKRLVERATVVDKRDYYPRTSFRIAKVTEVELLDERKRNK